MKTIKQKTNIQQTRLSKPKVGSLKMGNPGLTVTIKSQATWNTNDEKSGREIKETLPLTTATKRIKYKKKN